jgi:tetratricopeptide (TPR) repeat protein
MGQFRQRAARFATAAAVTLMVGALTAPSALAGLCFTSGKVYVQQKVWDKAARFLECARHEEPDNLQLYGLLGIARVQLREYRSAGAAFAIGIQMATEKNDEKRIKELKQNRDAALAGLYNKGLAAMSRAGNVELDTERTKVEDSPQAKLEKEKGAPTDFAKWSEGGAWHEVWYYADGGAYYFPPTGEDPTATSLTRFGGSTELQSAVADSTAFPDYDGPSKMLEAVYNFELASMVDPNSVDTYTNLSFLYERVGRIDDAIAAAKAGLALGPKKEIESRLILNLRAAAMGRGNRLYAERKFKESVPAYWAAMETDTTNRVIYLSRIAEAWLQVAEPLAKDSPERKAAFDSAATNFKLLYDVAPPDAHEERQNSIFNAAVIANNLGDYKKAAGILDKGLSEYPDNKDLQSLAGQTKFQAENYDGAIVNLQNAVKLDAKDPTNHQFLFLSYLKKGNKEASSAEYAIYKALREGKQRTGNDLKVWVDAADNRLGPSNKLKATVAAEGYPDEVYNYTDDGKSFESWFYWGKGKSVTFMEGQIFSQGTFPPQKIVN